MRYASAFSLILTLIVILYGLISIKKRTAKQNAPADPKRNRKQKLTARERSASELTNVIDIRDQFLYGRDGHIYAYLKITPVSLDLLSQREKEALSSVLSAELSRETKPFKLIALSRPVDITPLLDEYELLLSLSNNDKQKELLRLEMKQMNEYMNSEEVVERKFFISLWDKYYPRCEAEMLKRTRDFALSFRTANVGCEILCEDGIITFCNMIHNPAFIHLEDTDWRESIPIINMRGK